MAGTKEAQKVDIMAMGAPVVDKSGDGITVTPAYKINTLQELYRAMTQADDAQDRPFPVEVPPTTAAFRAFIDRLNALVRNGLQAACGQQEPAERAPAADVVNNQWTETDLDLAAFCMAALRPDDEGTDPKTAGQVPPESILMILDRKAGVIALAGKCVNIASRSQNVGGTIRVIGDLTRRLDDETRLDELPWTAAKGRTLKAELTKRGLELDEMYHEITNRNNVNAISRALTGPDQKTIVAALNVMLNAVKGQSVRHVALGNKEQLVGAFIKKLADWLNVLQKNGLLTAEIAQAAQSQITASVLLASDANGVGTAIDAANGVLYPISNPAQREMVKAKLTTAGTDEAVIIAFLETAEAKINEVAPRAGGTPAQWMSSLLTNTNSWLKKMEKEAATADAAALGAKLQQQTALIEGATVQNLGNIIAAAFLEKKTA